MKYWEDNATSNDNSSGYGRIGLPIQNGIDEGIAPQSPFSHYGCGVANFGSIADTHSAGPPIDQTEGSVVKAKTHWVNEMENLPGSGGDEDVDETSDTVDTMQENV